MTKHEQEVDQIQTQYEAYHLAIGKEESYIEFTTKDWRSPFIGYLAEGILPLKHGERYMLRKLTSHYFLDK